MGRRTSKDKQILKDARQGIEAATFETVKLQAERDELDSRLMVARAVVAALTESYAKLEKSLAPQPRQPATKTRAASTDTATEQRCAFRFVDLNGKVCGSAPEAAIHDPAQGSERLHAFQSAVKPPKKSSAKKRAELPVGCVATLPSNGEVCGAFEDNALHYDKGYADYHPFVKPATPRRSPTCSQCSTGINDNSHTNNALADFHPFVSSIPADCAQPPSSANGVGSSSTANSGTQPDSVSVAAHGASGD
jgi:hypothetical protein